MQTTGWLSFWRVKSSWARKEHDSRLRPSGWRTTRPVSRSSSRTHLLTVAVPRTSSSQRGQPRTFGHRNNDPVIAGVRVDPLSTVTVGGESFHQEPADSSTVTDRSQHVVYTDGFGRQHVVKNADDGELLNPLRRDGQSMQKRLICLI